MSGSDTDDENIIRYGTPLEPYEEDEIPSKRKYQEPADQYAVDAHGRRRFHGAFTGGFSAGFGNTVGSQEGWTPATFKSSRSEKAAVSGQRPEDYMDEEDRSEFGIAPKHIQTSIEYTGQKRPRARGFHDGPIPGEPVLEQLLRPVQETCAVQILRSMGWRPGQGAGTRRTQTDKRADKQQHRVYGCYMPPDMRAKEDSDKEDVSDSEVDYETLFAPDDYEPYVLNRKNDRFGLGYQGLSRHSVLGNLVGEYGSGDNMSHLVMKEKGKKVSIRGQAFGVGAFEADDEDIYATEDMSHYDFALGSSRDKQKVKPVKTEGPNILPGFTRATKPLPAVPSYPPPALPRDYTPVAAGTRRSRFEPTEAPQRDQGLGRHELTAEARGELLGETPSPKDTQTNTQTEAKKNDILAKIMGRNLDFVSTSDTTPDAKLEKGVTPNCETIKIIDMTKPKEQNAADFISIKDSGKELTKIFKPFANNPKKQARYEAYCEKGVLDRDGDVDQLSEWEREREMVEFEQAAKLYRPLTGIMGDRFTHASQPDDAVNPLSAVARSGAHRGAATAEQRDAAQRGVYGVMTRHEAPWRPDSVVCKRFNVPEPNVTRLEPKKEDRPKISYSVFSYMESSVHDKDSFTKEQGKFSGSKSHLDKSVKNNEPMQTICKSSDQKVEGTKPITEPLITHDPFKRMTVAELFLKESESTKDQGKEVTETIEKFDKMDLYKSIFLSDSEEEPANGKNEEKETDFVEVPKNIVRNTSPPRGIFANIDFDELNSWRRTDESVKKEAAKNNEDSGKNNEDKLISNNEEMDTETYGPKIPDSLKQRLETVGRGEPSNTVQVIDSTSSNDSWVDLKEVKAKKSKKKNKKHKSKHKVKKSKHKKKDR